MRPHEHWRAPSNNSMNPTALRAAGYPGRSTSEGRGSIRLPAKRTENCSSSEEMT